MSAESNWLWFLYNSQCSNSGNRIKEKTTISPDTDYIFYYHPKHLEYNSDTGVVVNADSKERYQTTAIVNISDNAMILEIIDN
ncbi:MAG: hypothetical protein HQL49_10005 [Gammaproteobacteria bacterium]|nr:hypothetical protein [Gammaproteobacteria bacterium]